MSLGTTLQDPEQAPKGQLQDKGHWGDVVRKDNDPHGSQRGLMRNFYYLYLSRSYFSPNMCSFRPKQTKKDVLLFLKIPT